MFLLYGTLSWSFYNTPTDHPKYEVFQLDVYRIRLRVCTLLLQRLFWQHCWSAFHWAVGPRAHSASLQLCQCLRRTKQLWSLELYQWRSSKSVAWQQHWVRHNTATSGSAIEWLCQTHERRSWRGTVNLGSTWWWNTLTKSLIVRKLKDVL